MLSLSFVIMYNVMYLKICGATQERNYHEEDCSVLHVELRIDDAVVMIETSSESYPPNELLGHVYVQNGDAVFKKALQAN